MVFILIFLCLMLSIIYASIRYGIGPVPSHPKVFSIFQKLPIDFTGKKIIDLGSGWGQFCYKIAKKYPNTLVIGYEISFIPYFFSKIFFRKSNLRFYRKNFYQTNLNHFDIIFCYLFPDAMSHLQKKFEKELSTKTIIISYTFKIHSWKEKDQYILNDLFHSRLYVYSSSDNISSERTSDQSDKNSSRNANAFV